MDWSGFVAFTVFITSFLLMLTFAAYGTAESLLVAMLCLVAFATFATFLFIERRNAHPLLDLSLLRIREYVGGVTT